MLSGIALASGKRCNQEVEYLREPRVKHLSAYVVIFFLSAGRIDRYFFEIRQCALILPQFWRKLTICGNAGNVAYILEENAAKL